MNPVAGTVDDVTPEWLTFALRAAGLEVEVTDVEAERVGTGQIGESYRLSLTYGTGASAPETLVAKLAGGSVEARQRVAGGYEKEVGFYTELAGTVHVRTPRCWYGAITEDNMSFTLLLDDLAPSRPGVQADGCSPAQAADGVRNLVGLHAPRWNDEALLGFPFLTPTDEATAAFLGELMIGATEDFAARYEDALDALDVRTLRDVAHAITAWQLARPVPFSLVHGDYRLDNLMFPPEGDAGVTALDWQTVTVGPPMRDVAYFLGTSLDVELRRRHEEELVAVYHRELQAHEVVYDEVDCFEDYRLGHLQGPMITVLGCMFATAERSRRADGMFLAMATRSCAAIRDLGSLAML